ncbi:MAG TPA: methyltransferase [Tepidisphaeraceae bacterium]|nr:methyltransferase [Tepidisphaeraceae bacterium]
MNPAPIFEYFTAYQKTAAMQAAVDIGLFSAIAKGSSTVSTIAKACNASPKGVRVLCDYWTVQGLLRKSNDTYALTPEAATFLDRTSPAYLGGVMGFLNGPIKPFFEQLTDAVRRGGCESTGTVEVEYDGWIPFAEEMGAMMFPTAQAISKLLGKISGRVLDVAAGHGLFGIVLAQANPDIKVTALDWPRVLDVAKQHAAKMGVSDRYSTIAGDAFKVDLNGPYDLILLTNLLHHFSTEQCITLLKRLRSALRPGGQLVTLEFVPNEDRVSPPMSATFPLVMLATTERGDAYTFAELDRMLRSAGFANNKLHQPENSPQQIIVSL